MGKLTIYKWPVSIAMLNYQRVPIIQQVFWGWRPQTILPSLQFRRILGRLVFDKLLWRPIAVEWWEAGSERGTDGSTTGVRQFHPNHIYINIYTYSKKTDMSWYVFIYVYYYISLIPFRTIFIYAIYHIYIYVYMHMYIIYTAKPSQCSTPCACPLELRRRSTLNSWNSKVENPNP